MSKIGSPNDSPNDMREGAPGSPAFAVPRSASPITTSSMSRLTSADRPVQHPASLSYMGVSCEVHVLAGCDERGEVFLERHAEVPQRSRCECLGAAELHSCGRVASSDDVRSRLPREPLALPHCRAHRRRLQRSDRPRRRLAGCIDPLDRTRELGCGLLRPAGRCRRNAGERFLRRGAGRLEARDKLLVGCPRRRSCGALNGESHDHRRNRRRRDRGAQLRASAKGGVRHRHEEASCQAMTNR